MAKGFCRGAAAAAVVWLVAGSAAGQLRIVTYNTLRGPNPGLSTVLTAIGEETVLGVAKPIDVLLLQEQDEPSTTTQAIVDELNAVYGPGAYRRGAVATGPSFSSLRQSIVYRADTVQLIDERAIGSAGLAPLAPRQALRARLRPVGYGASADFYVYNSHFKAGGASSDAQRRTQSALALRADADTLGDDAAVIFGGDFNLRSSAEGAFVELTRPGGSQAYDPEGFPGTWKNNFNARFVHTHGGTDVDDRFDFLLPTTEWHDGEGLDLIAGSYRPFGNNGSTYDSPVNASFNTYDFNFGATATHTRQQVLDALVTASDHLPVVADLQVPAILSAWLGELPTTLTLGAAAGLDVWVQNAADVVTAIGADELDYTVEWTGATSGLVSGSDLADGVAQLIAIPLDASTVGAKSLSIAVTTDSPGAPLSLLNFDVRYEVIADPAGDFNADGSVDAADYTVWRDGLGAEFVAEDYAIWAAAYGDTAAPVGGAVPEPSAGWIAAASVLGAATGRRKATLRRPASPIPATHLPGGRRSAAPC